MRFEILTITQDGKKFYRLTVRRAIDNKFVVKCDYKYKTHLLKAIGNYFESGTA